MTLGGHTRKKGRSVHFSGMYKELVPVMAAILARVQFHINLLSPYSVSRCFVVSMASQVLHRFVSVRLTAARRSLVGVRLWITIYHVDRGVSEIHGVWRFVHRRFQLTSGYLRTIRITSPLSVLLRMALSVPFIRFLSLHMVSFVRGVDTYAMTREYWRTWTSLPGEFAYTWRVFYCIGYVPLS
jgi:hypothetical protein